MTHSMVESITVPSTREQRLLARYEKRPAPPSVYKDMAKKEGRLILIIGLGLVALTGIHFLLSFGVFALWVVWVFVLLTCLSRLPLFIQARLHRHATDHAWKQKPEWALEQLMSYHKLLTRQEPQNVVLRREHNVRALKMLGASTLAFALCKVVVVLTQGHAIAIVVTYICALFGTIFTGVPTVLHLRQQRKMRDYELERDAFRKASNEISEGMLLVGALSSPIEETGGEMSMLGGVETEEVKAHE